MTHDVADPESQELPDWVDTQDWIDSMRDVVRTRGNARASGLLQALQIEAQRTGVQLPVTSRTPYVNSILPEHQAPFPGDNELERRIKSIVRWNAMAMVTEANGKSSESVGTSPPTPPRRRCTRWGSTTSSGGTTTRPDLISSISRATPPPACTHAPTWKVA